MLRFCDLGALRVRVAGVDHGAGGARPGAVLAALLVELGEPVPAARLVEAVWGERPPHRAAAVLESHVWRLRRVLEPGRSARERPRVLVTDRGGYRLVADPEIVDSGRLRAAVTQGRAELAAGRPEACLDLVEAVERSWRGRPYGDLDLPWLDPVRTRLEDLWFTLRELRVTALLELGRPEPALAELDLLIGEAPYRENLHSQRMVALYRCGRQSAALDAYRDVRALLRNDLGVEPGLGLRETERRVLIHDPGLESPAAPPVVAPPPVDLPARLSEILGRERELSALTDALRRRRLVSVVGPMGCGKTRLAVEAAHVVGETFPEGVRYVALAGITTPTSAAVATAIASALHLAVLSQASPMQTLTSFTRGRRLLLVLDNCEHLLDAVHRVVEELVAAATALTVLATSRSALGIDGEHTVAIGPFPVPADPAEVDQNPGALLFADRVRAFEPAFALTEDTAGAVATICAAVDGIPLGLELAASRLRAFTLDDVARLLTEHPGGLRRATPGPRRHRSLADAVEWSHDLLDADEQIVHRRLGVLEGTFSASAADAVCIGLPLPGSFDVPDVLASLVHRSLLSPVPPAVPGGRSRFVQLVPVRSHARAALTAAGETDTVRVARDDWTAGLVAARPRLGRPEQDGWYDALETDHDQVRALFRDTLRPEVEPGRRALGVAAAARMATFWHNRSRMVEGLGWLAAAEAVVDPGDLPTRTVLHAASGTAWGLNQQMDRARPHISAALAGLGEVPPGDRAEAGQALAELAAASWVGDDPTLAAELAAHAETVGAADADVVLGARAVSAASAILLRAPGAADRARSVLTDAIAGGNPFAAFFTSMALGVEALLTGDPTAGLALSEPTMRHYLAMGGRDLGDLLEQQANHYAPAGHLAEAERCYTAARGWSDRAGREWPRHPHTVELLALTRARRGMTTDSFRAPIGPSTQP